MRLVPLWLLLGVGVLLGGCAGFNQPFACAPGEGSQRLDVDQYRVPSTTAGTGFPHCA